MTAKIKFLKIFSYLFKPYRYKIAHGGRASAKSTHYAIALILKARTKKLRILCTREIQNTIKDSVYKLLSDIIATNKFNDFEITKDSIRNKLTGSEFIFRGLHRNAGEIKSLEGIDIVWVEEAHAVTTDSWQLLIPTIRKEGSEIWVTFNRMFERDPVYFRYCIKPPLNSIVKKVNFEHAEKAGLLSQTILDEKENDRINNPDEYAHVWLGEPVSQSPKSALNRNAVLEAMERDISDEGDYSYGVDVARQGDDRTVFVERKGLKVVRWEIYDKNTMPEAEEYLKTFVKENKSAPIKIDDSGIGGSLTDYMTKAGYNAVPVNNGEKAMDSDKYANSISEMYFEFKKILSNVQIPNDPDLLNELTTREFSYDDKDRRKIEKKAEYKKRMKKSPDLADAILLCFYNKRNIEPTIEIW